MASWTALRNTAFQLEYARLADQGIGYLRGKMFIHRYCVGSKFQMRIFRQYLFIYFSTYVLTSHELTVNCCNTTGSKYQFVQFVNC